MNKKNELNFWSVGIISSSDNVKELIIHEDLKEYKIKPHIRKSNNPEKDDDSTHRIQTLSSATHESFDLNDEEYNAALIKWKVSGGEEKKNQKGYIIDGLGVQPFLKIFILIKMKIISDHYF